MILLRHNMLPRLFFALFIVVSFFVPRIAAKGCCGGCRGGGARSGGVIRGRGAFMHHQQHYSSEEQSDMGVFSLCMPIGVIIGWSKVRWLFSFDCDKECTCSCELTCCRPLYWWDLLVMVAIISCFLMIIQNSEVTVAAISIFGGWLFLKIIGFWGILWAKK